MGNRKTKLKKKYLRMMDLHNKLVLLVRDGEDIDIDSELVQEAIKSILKASKHYTSFGVIENLNKLVEIPKANAFIMEQYVEVVNIPEKFVEFMAYEDMNKDLAEGKDSDFQSLASDALTELRSTPTVSRIKMMGDIVKEIRKFTALQDGIFKTKTAILNLLKVSEEAINIALDGLLTEDTIKPLKIFSNLILKRGEK